VAEPGDDEKAAFGPGVEILRGLPHGAGARRVGNLGPG
jgi:hypothetical protein